MKDYTRTNTNWQQEQLKHYPPASETWIDHPSHARPGIHAYPDKLYVLTMLENPLRWRSRYNNYWAFQHHVENGNAELYTAEIAFGGRKFEITEPDNPRHLQLRTNAEVWHKENALNLLAERLPKDAKYIAWIDADIQFTRPDWAQECLHLLQHYDVIQMFSRAQNLGPDGDPQFGPAPSFMYQFCEHGVPPHAEEFMDDRVVHWTERGVIGAHTQGGYYGPGPSAAIWHPGLAWAMRRSAWDHLGGLMDFLVTGSGDWHMSNALIGNLMKSVDKRHTPGYLRGCQIWEDRAEQYIRRNVGYMKGLVSHAWHGTHANRAYAFRHKFIINVEFDPDFDLKRDWQGLYQLTDRSIKLRDGMRLYNRMRDEDATNGFTRT